MSPPVLSSEVNYSRDTFQFHNISYPEDDYIGTGSDNISNSYFDYQRANHSINYYHLVYKFILSKLIPKYDELKFCDIFYEDIEGNPSNEYHIKFDGNLSFNQRNDLHCNILKDIYDFCRVSAFSTVFDNITIFLVKL